MGYVLALLFLIINLLTNSHYGFTWDLPHHFNAGLRHLGLPPEDPQFGTQPYGPISDILPVLSWLYLSKNWHLLPADEAYHILIIISASIGILLIYSITKKIYGLLPAFFVSLILGLYPRYIGESHNNTKDIPSSVAICLAIFLFLFWMKKLQKKEKNKSSNSQLLSDNLNKDKKMTRLRVSFFDNFLSHLSFISYLLFPALAVGLAFNIKINAVLIPPIILLWLLVSFRDQIKLKLPNLLKSQIGPINLWLVTCYLFLSVVFSLLIWYPFWSHPWEELIYVWKHFSQSTTGFWILYYGKIYLANINVPWHYAFGYLLAVTPALVIFFFLLGFIKAVYDTITLKNRYSGLILMWFLVPTLKYADPKVGVLDGIRHFLEVLFPLAILAGLGVNIVYNKIVNIFLIHNPLASPAKRGKQLVIRKLVFTCYLLLVTCYLIIQVLPLHPYETAYYSEWLGGVKGAQGKFDIEYWGNALKEGSRYLNQQALKNSEVAVPFAQQVVQKYLRSDLSIIQYPTPNTKYLMFFNRSSFFDMYPQNQILKDYINNKKPLFTITRQQTPLLWIYKYP